MISRSSLIALPGDAGAHPWSNVEWWYCYALLTGSRGGRYAVMASFFRVGEWAAPKGHYIIHSLVRLDRARFESSSALDRSLAVQMAGVYLPAYLLAHPTDGHTWDVYRRLLANALPAPHRFMPSSSVDARPTRLVYGQNRMTFADDRDAGFELKLEADTARLRLNFAPSKPLSVIDETGGLNGLRYYSQTRSRVHGELYEEGRAETLRGEGWFDHQWGRSYGLLTGEGWDWFGLQLEDGRELLVSRLRPAGAGAATDGEALVQARAEARLIGPDGSTTPSNRVVLRPLRRWRSEDTGADYPVAWAISLPDFGMTISVAPLMDRQEMPVLGPLRAIWEGVVAFEGDERDGEESPARIAGYGFMELVGYPQSARTAPASFRYLP
ncbi:lipocalin family protein [Cohnella hashimotonis]|uniref:Lipocalin family protein n=1 Tax=Cohnella hashimotonis TaxID=2826895 RepID=A0ABT6TPN2_9BACL|nr:lipocalin family protein [Cohnella hashimotonis]MDI4648689.1 lipocalin family protein [Cohnella hashimotonis]